MTGMYILVDLNFYLCNPARNYSTIINQVLCNPFNLWRASSSLASLLPGPTAQYRFPSSVQELKKRRKGMCLLTILDIGSPNLVIPQGSIYKVIWSTVWHLITHCKNAHQDISKLFMSPGLFTRMLAPQKIRQDTRNVALVAHNFT